MPASFRTLGASFVVATAIALSGCGLSRKMATVAPTEKAPRGLPSDQELEVGTIAFVRGTAKPFVLIRMAQELPLPEQARLQTRPDGDRTPALLQLSSERRGHYRTADILNGQPRLGERVVFPYPKGDTTDLPVVSVFGETVPADPASAPNLESDPEPDPDIESDPSWAGNAAGPGAGSPIRLGERVQVRTTVGDEPPTVVQWESGPDEIDAALPLPSRSDLPGQEIPFIETVEGVE